MTAQKRPSAPSALEDLEDRIMRAALNRHPRPRMAEVWDDPLVEVEWECAPCGRIHRSVVRRVESWIYHTDGGGHRHLIQLGDDPVDLRCPKDRQGWRQFA